MSTKTPARFFKEIAIERPAQAEQLPHAVNGGGEHTFYLRLGKHIIVRVTGGVGVAFACLSLSAFGLLAAFFIFERLARLGTT